MAKPQRRGTQHRTTEQLLADAENRANDLRDRVRKEHTRRKILVGSMVLSLAQSDDVLRDFLKSRLDERLSERDRRLFFSRDHLGLAIAGLHGAALYPAERRPGWALGQNLCLAAEPGRDRAHYGNAIDA